MQVVVTAGEGQTSRSGLTVTVALEAPTRTLPDPKPSMSNHAHRKWILDLMEEMDVDDDHEHDSNYASDSSGESPDPVLEVERQITNHFSVHPELCRQFKHPAQNVPCIFCDCKPFKSVGDVYMHAVKTRTKPTAHRGLAAAIRWLHGGKEPPRQ